MKKILLSCAFIVSLSQLAFAESSLNFAFVDMQKALQGSKAGKQAQQSYENEVKKEQVSIDGMRKEYQEKKDALEKQKSGLNKSALSKRNKELSSLENKMKKAFQESQINLRKKNSKIVGGLIKELRVAVEEFGEKKSYTMIFEKGSGSLLYGSKGVDITNDVIKSFNERTKGKKF